jgi:hypothetical protein
VSGAILMLTAVDWMSTEKTLTVSAGLLLGGHLAVKGWYSGTSIDSQDTLAFSARAGVRSMNEVFPLERFSCGADRWAGKSGAAIMSSGGGGLQAW